MDDERLKELFGKFGNIIFFLLELNVFKSMLMGFRLPFQLTFY